MQRGTIALDIDGTITDEHHQIPDEVALLFETLFREGWSFVFITGREFVYAMEALSKLSIPFNLAVQNGADLITMPDHLHLKSFYLNQEAVEAGINALQNIKGAVLLYAGYERGDFCYYEPHRQAKEMEHYLERMQRRCPLPWQAVESFKIPIQHEFAMLKAIGQKEDLLEVERKLLEHHQLECVMIQDPKSTLYHYLLVTAAKASKKAALEYFLKEKKQERPLIVAGDDYNDRGALELADVRIVMNSAPPMLKTLADIVAPSSKEYGIIPALGKAIEHVQRHKREWA